MIPMIRTPSRTVSVITSLLFLTTRHLSYTTASSSPKLVQVQIVHRHGDRTPITPMRNITFWEGTLPPSETISKLQQDLHILRHEHNTARPHAAGGKGPFGQLTTLGLFQMVQLGQQLRETLSRQFGDMVPPRRMRVSSTDFPRTIQSVTGVLAGLYPEGVPAGLTVDDATAVEKLIIDARHTHLMIPDPQPRRTVEQVILEKELSQKVKETEREMTAQELAKRVSQVLRAGVLGEGAEDVTFGVGEEKEGDVLDKPLPWGQLAEITKCLKVRDLLPKEITHEDQEVISSHAAWRWFETLRHPRLARLAMHGMVEQMITNAHEAKTSHVNPETDDHILLHLYSAHDSTLIGLMCAFRLEQPAVWPEYGSYLTMELWEESDKKHYLKFLLNGQVLRSYWGVDEGESPVEMIELERLMSLIDEEGAVHDTELSSS